MVHAHVGLIEGMADMKEGSCFLPFKGHAGHNPSIFDSRWSGSWSSLPWECTLQGC